MSKANTILIKNKEGKVLEVFEKSYQVVYKNMGFYPVSEKNSKEKEPVDFEAIAAMSEKELKKVNNDDLKAYLDDLEIEYGSKATKDELIALIVGEDDGEGRGQEDPSGEIN